MGDAGKLLLEPRVHHHCKGDMMGSSPALQGLIRQIDKAAAVDAPVVIAGESGSGKEVTALAIHRQSRRVDKPFIPVNCAALPSNLFQSELFGYEKGAFTGATQRKIGFIERAIGGTLFLDELGDLSLDLQVNLLRFLQQGTISRVGGKEEIAVDVRVMVATHVDLEKAIEQGRFREDLFYRLNVLRLRVPPLRERKSDIELLANHFLWVFSREGNLHVKGFSQEALKAMLDYPWPGNIRELMNRVRRAIAMCEGPIITLADMGLERRSGSRFPDVQTLQQARGEAERKAIAFALRSMNNNISRAAQALGTSRVTLYKLIGKHKIYT